ncbi:putative Ig domain-containing protein, partial [Akkermansiaceae bacterium]|nr:putative Ig domain-containing protein [Akkermansiaceae bacterium]
GQHQADWMSGKWGIGFRIVANPSNWNNIDNYDVDSLVSQVSSISDVSYVIFNLTDAAHGDTYIAPHSVISAINPTATPPSGRDLFGELATAFQAQGIQVIAYVATQGPAMLKHGAEKAYDSVFDPVAGVWTSVAMDNWEAHVLQEYGSVTDDIYRQAFAEVIVDEYAKRYGTLVDGWWFDNGFAAISPTSGALLKQICLSANPASTLTFNADLGGISLSHYKGGHPIPLVQAAPSDSINLDYLLYPIESSEDGFLTEVGNELVLGHMFMAMHDKWNSGDLVWTAEQGADWMARCLNAGGAWTWNLDTNDSQSILRADTVTLLQEILTKMDQPNTAPQLSAESYLLAAGDVDVPFAESLANLASDPDGDTLSFALIEGPAWLSISETGDLSGTPSASDAGDNLFTLLVSDGNGATDLAELKIPIIPDIPRSLTQNFTFSELRGDLSRGRINDRSFFNHADLSLTKITSGNDLIYTFSMNDLSLDSFGTGDDSLAWDIRVEGFTGGTFNINGNDSTATLGTNALVEASNNEIGGLIGGRFLQGGEALRITLENLRVTGSPGVFTSDFQGFDTLWGTAGTYIFGNGTGLESLVHTINEEFAAPTSNPLIITATTSNDRFQDLAGSFSLTTYSLLFFSQDEASIELNFDEPISTNLDALNLTTSSFPFPGETLIYRIVSGPAWLSIDSNGAFTGSPSLADFGTNAFVIEVKDENGAIDSLRFEVDILVDTFRSTYTVTSTGDLRLTWPSAPGLTFDIVSSTTLDTPRSQWPIHNVNIPAHATEASTSFEIPTPDQARFFSVKFCPE